MAHIDSDLFGIEQTLADINRNTLDIFKYSTKQLVELMNTRRILRVALENLSINKEDFVRIASEKVGPDRVKEVMSYFDESENES
jgi:Mg2+/Co2+ transporter CorB